MCREVISIKDGIQLSSDGHQTMTSLQKDTIRITSRCLGIPESVQRPIDMTHIKIAQLNVAEGEFSRVSCLLVLSLY